MSNELRTFEAYTKDGYRIKEKDVTGTCWGKRDVVKLKSGRMLQLIDVLPVGQKTESVTIYIKITI